jgi:hypothetical protein
LPHPTTGPGEDTCKFLYTELLVLKPGDTTRAVYEKDFAAMCKEPMPKPPVDTTAKPPVPPTVVGVDCDALRAKLALLDSTSADAIRLEGSLKEHCPEK